MRSSTSTRAPWVALLLLGSACGPDPSDPIGSSSPTSVASSAAVDARAEAALDEEKKKKLREQLGEPDMPPDAEAKGPVLAPTEGNLAALLAGGAALEGLAVRSTDPGKDFDRYLPARLKPVAPPDPRAPKPKCDPRDPLCVDL